MAWVSRRRKFLVALGAAVAVALVAIPVALAAFGGKTANEGDIITAAPDLTPPTIAAKVVAKSLGGVTGYVRKGGGYYVYASVTDTGAPSSLVSTVKTNAAEFTAGSTEVPLVAGSYTIEGVTYNYRSAELSATATVEGTKNYTVTAVDGAGNTKTVTGTGVVDNTPPTAANIGTTNVAGGVNGLAEQGDTVIFTFSEPVDPQSILAGWTGASTPVVVRMIDGGILNLGLDELSVFNSTNTTQLPFGAVNLGRNDYVTGLLGGQINFGASGTPSTMVMSGNTVTITLGTYGAVGILVGRNTAAGTGTMIWSPPTTNPAPTIYDRAGNVQTSATATQSPAPTKGF
jgi:hypothetical protein